MAFTDNVIWVRDGDGQNCFNQGSYLPGHGLEYARNKCILPFSKTVGHVSGCDCAATLDSAPNASVGPSPPHHHHHHHSRRRRRRACAFFVFLGTFVVQYVF